jgi:hypothetical protein
MMPSTAAESIRRIGGRRRTAPSAPPRGFVCRPCATSWTGPEADCFNCGRPATQEYSTQASALSVLLSAAKPQCREHPGTSPSPTSRDVPAR